MTFDVSNKVKGLITLIIGVIVIFTILASTASDLQTAGTNVSNSGLPLAGLFGGNGVIMLIIMAGILVSIIAVAMKSK